MIGLERLLVPGGSDLSYRFKFHGAVLLANDSEKLFDLYEKLGKIYNMRSGSAHGETRGETLEDARDARIYLSKAIFNIAMLCDKDKLPCKDRNQNPLEMAASLQKLIITKSSLISDWIRKQY